MRCVTIAIATQKTEVGAKTAKRFITGRSQAVKLPAEFRLEESEFFVRRDLETGNAVLSCTPQSRNGLFEPYRKGNLPDDLLGPLTGTCRFRIAFPKPLETDNCVGMKR